MFGSDRLLDLSVCCCAKAQTTGAYQLPVGKDVTPLSGCTPPSLRLMVGVESSLLQTLLQTVCGMWCQQAALAKHHLHMLVRHVLQSSIWLQL
jgi:hypothetical protein